MRGMSSDGAIDKPRSVRPARGDDRGLAGIALGALLLLALIATVVMVFSDNPVWMRIGTLSALWAAFIGAFLVARYRRPAAAEAARVRDLHTVYELQLEREISARREHELVVEKDLRDTVRAETSDSIYGLRQEIAALREQLGQMGVNLSEDRLAVGGDTAAGELGAGTSLPSVPSERVEPRRRAPGSSSFPPPGSSPTRSRPSVPEPTVTGVGRDVTPSTERTEKLSPVDAEQTRAPHPQGQSRGPAVRPAGRTQPEQSPAETTAQAEQPRAETSAQADQPRAESRTQAGHRAEAPSQADTSSEAENRTPSESAPRSVPASSPAAADASPASRHGDGTGLSVSELMARLGDDAPSGGRRRRRSAD